MPNTIFGEVTAGMDVVNKINSVATDKADKPQKEQKILKAFIRPPEMSQHRAK